MKVKNMTFLISLLLILIVALGAVSAADGFSDSVSDLSDDSDVLMSSDNNDLDDDSDWEDDDYDDEDEDDYDYEDEDAFYESSNYCPDCGEKMTYENNMGAFCAKCAWKH